MKLKKRFLFLCLAVLITIPAVWGQDNDIDNQEAEFSLSQPGDQFINLHAGIMLPLFFHFYQDATIGDNGFIGAMDKYKAPVGGVFGLGWNIYAVDKLALGVDFSGNFLVDHAGVPFVLALSAKVSYVFEAYPFEFPISMGIGLFYSRMNDDYYVGGPLLKPGAAAIWNINPEWGVGLKLDYWWIPEVYFDDAKKANSAFGNFLEIGIAAVYHIR